MRALTPILRAKKRARSTGFTLVEVTLALGVIAFGMIAVFGLLPVGLSTFHESIASTVETQIVGKVSGVAQQTNFRELNSDMNGKTFYFDADGEILSSAQGSTYVAECKLLSNPVILSPESAAAVAQSSNLAIVALNIYANRGNQPRDRGVKKFVYVANLGK